MPKQEHMGYFSVVEIERLSGDNRKVTLVATTRKLQQRWFQSPVAAIDGGFKFAIMGWPVHVLGVMNDDQELCYTGLGITSTMKQEHIVAMVNRYNNAATNATGKVARKRFGICDAEEAYRQALSKACGRGMS